MYRISRWCLLIFDCRVRHGLDVVILRRFVLPGCSDAEGNRRLCPITVHSLYRFRAFPCFVFLDAADGHCAFA